MSTLAEIETAADTLPPQEKQELILFLAARLGPPARACPSLASFPASRSIHGPPKMNPICNVSSPAHAIVSRLPVELRRRVGYIHATKTTAVKLPLPRWPYGLEIESSPEGLLLRPRRKARANWTRAFRHPKCSCEDLAATRQLANKFDHEEWEW